MFSIFPEPSIAFWETIHCSYIPSSKHQSFYTMHLPLSQQLGDDILFLSVPLLIFQHWNNQILGQILPVWDSSVLYSFLTMCWLSRNVRSLPLSIRAYNVPTKGTSSSLMRFHMWEKPSVHTVTFYKTTDSCYLDPMVWTQVSFSKANMDMEEDIQLHLIKCVGHFHR